MVRPPVVGKTSDALPAVTATVEFVVPSPTITLPVGVPAPGALALTVNGTVTVCPGVADAGESVPSTTLVAALLIVTANGADVLGLKLESPLNSAVMLCAPVESAAVEYDAAPAV